MSYDVDRFEDLNHVAADLDDLMPIDQMMRLWSHHREPIDWEDMIRDIEDHFPDANRFPKAAALSGLTSYLLRKYRR